MKKLLIGVFAVLLLVIIGEIAFLITAYYIGGSNTRGKLETKYEKRVDAG